MQKYKDGLFNWTSKGEANFAMLNYVSKLEHSLRDDEIDYEIRHRMNSEIEALTIRIARSRNSSMFDLEGFLECQKRYKKEPEYREMVNQKIAGTWVDPKKAEIATAKAATKNKETEAS